MTLLALKKKQSAEVQFKKAVSQSAALSGRPPRGQVIQHAATKLGRAVPPFNVNWANEGMFEPSDRNLPKQAWSVLQKQGADAANNRLEQHGNGKSTRFICQDHQESGDMLEQSAFLEKLKGVVYAGAGKELAKYGIPIKDCTLIKEWFDKYAKQEPERIERAIGLFAPETKKATNVDELMPLIVEALTAAIKKERLKQLAAGQDEKNEAIQKAGSVPIKGKVMQRCQFFSNLFRGRPERTRNERTVLLEDVESRMPKPQTRMLDQGQGEEVFAGDMVINGEPITTCALVIGYGENGILAYHWPFSEPSHKGSWDKLIERYNIGVVHKYEVVNKPYGNTHDISDPLLTVLPKSKTILYYMQDERITPSVRIGPLGIQEGIGPLERKK